MALLRFLPVAFVTILSVPIIFQIEVIFHLQKLYHSWLPLNIDSNEAFDFIVVGAGKT